MSVKNLEGEIWKDVITELGAYPNYQVSNMGRVKSLNYRHTGKEQVLKTNKTRQGYLMVYLYRKTDGKYFSVHRLVAIAFLENPLNLPCVNHKIEGKEGRSMNFVFFKTDGEVDLERTSIEWCSVSYNNTYGSATERRIEKFKETIKTSTAWKEGIERKKETIKNSTAFKEGIERGAAKRSKQVFQYTTDGKLVNIYPSVSEAERQTGFNLSNISACCNGKYKTYKSYVWGYTDLTSDQILDLIKSKKRGGRQCKQVFQYTTDGKLVNIYPSISEAERQTGFQSSSIRAACRGDKKSYKNFIWSYSPLECFQLTLFPLTETKKIS